MERNQHTAPWMTNQPPNWDSPLPEFGLGEGEDIDFDTIFRVTDEKTFEVKPLPDTTDAGDPRGTDFPALTEESSPDTTNEPITPEPGDANTKDVPGILARSKPWKRQQRTEASIKTQATKKKVPPRGKVSKRRRRAKRNRKPEKLEFTTLRLKSWATTSNSAARPDVDSLLRDDLIFTVHVGSQFLLVMKSDGEGTWRGENGFMEVWAERAAMVELLSQSSTESFQYRWLDTDK